MPFDSDKQRRYLWSQKPEVAKKIAYKQQGGLTDFDSWTDVAPEQQTHQAALNAALDFTPGIGDVKGLLEAESGLDYGLAALGVLPGGKALKKLPLEELMRKRKELIDEYTFGDEVPEIYVHSSRSPDLDLDTFNYRPVNVPTKAAHGKGAGIFTHGLSDVDNFSDYGDYKYAVVKRPGVSYPGQIDDVDTRGEIFIPQNLVEDIVPLNFNDGGSVPGGDMQVKKMTQKDRYGNQITYEYDLPDQTKLMEKQMDMMVPEMPDIPRQVSSMEMQMGYDHPGEPKGSDTVPAWLTPGEFVVNAEAMRHVPGAHETVSAINDMGREIQRAQGGSIPQYHNSGGFAGRFYGGIPADIQLAIGDAGVPQAAGAPAPIPQPQAEVPAVAEPPAPQEFDRAGLIDKVLDFEGGFVDKKEDRGGRTNFGITQKTWDAHTDGQGGDVKDLSKDQAKEFYSNLYDQYKLERFPAQIRGKMFDMIVNHGYGNAAKILQRAGGVERDGKIGPATLRAVQGLSVDDLADARQGFYDDIIANDPTQEVFKKGWYSRNDKWRTQHKADGGWIDSTLDFLTPKLPSWAGGSEDNVLAGLARPPEAHSIDEFSDIGRDFTQSDVAREEFTAPPAPVDTGLEGYEAPSLPEDQTIFRQTDDSLLQLDTQAAQDWEAQTAESEKKKAETPLGKVDPLIQEAVKEAAKMEKAAGQPQTGPDADQPGPTVDETELQAAAANAVEQDPTFFQQLQSQFMDQFKDIASPENIAGMAMRYLGSRALGYSHSGSLGWAAKSQLGEHVQKEQMLSQTAKELAKQAKYTPASIQRFKETGDESVLQPVSTGANIKRTKAKPDAYYNADGKKVQAFEYEDGSGNKYLGDSSGRPIDTGGLHQEPWRVQGTKEWNTRVNQNRKVTTDQLKSLRNQFGVVGKTAEGSNIYGTEINPETQAGEIAKWAAKNNVAPEELAGLVSSAYHNALNEPRQDGKKVRDLTSHLNDLVIRSSVGSPDLFKTETGGFVASDKLAVVNNVIERKLQQAGVEGNVKNIANQYYNDALTDWTALGPEGQKKYNDRANEDENGFYLFIANELGIDNRVK